MDLLTQIEEAVGNVLKTIDGTVQHSGYTFHTTTGSIDIEDEAVIVAVDRAAGNTGAISYTMAQAPDEVNIEWGDANCVLTNQITYKITAKVKNHGKVQFPRKEIRSRCSEVLADCKFAFFNDHSLGGLVNWIKYDRSQRIYLDSSDLVRTADLEMYFEVNYGQQTVNPDIAGNN